MNAENNFFVGLLVERYSSQGKNLSKQVQEILNKSYSELTEEEREAYEKIISPNRPSIKNALTEKLLEPEASRTTWERQLSLCPQSIIGQIASEILEESAVKSSDTPIDTSDVPATADSPIPTTTQDYPPYQPSKVGSSNVPGAAGIAPSYRASLPGGGSKRFSPLAAIVCFMFVLFIVSLILVFAIQSPSDALVTQGNWSGARRSAASDNDVNQRGTSYAPQQTVANGWYTNDLLVIISEQNDAIIASNAETANEIQATRRLQSILIVILIAAIFTFALLVFLIFGHQNKPTNSGNPDNAAGVNALSESAATEQ